MALMLNQFSASRVPARLPRCALFAVGVHWVRAFGGAGACLCWLGFGLPLACPFPSFDKPFHRKEKRVLFLKEGTRMVFATRYMSTCNHGQSEVAPGGSSEEAFRAGKGGSYRYGKK